MFYWRGKWRPLVAMSACSPVRCIGCRMKPTVAATQRRSSITSDGYVPALAAAEADRSIPIWLHTHPGNESTPRPSKRDELVDRQLADLFRLRAGSPLYGAIVIARPGGRPCFAGHIESDNWRADIDRLWVTGRRLVLVQNWLRDHNATSRAIRPQHPGLRRRHPTGSSAIYALPSSAAAVPGLPSLSNSFVLAYAISSCSIRTTLTAGNVTRVYGSYLDSVGEPKVNVSAAHVTRIAADADVMTAQAKITVESTARLLLDADVVFGLHR